MIMERLEASGDLKKVSSYYALTDELLLLPIPLNFLKDVLWILKDLHKILNDFLRF